MKKLSLFVVPLLLSVASLALMSTAQASPMNVVSTGIQVSANSIVTTSPATFSRPYLIGTAKEYIAAPGSVQTVAISIKNPGGSRPVIVETLSGTQWVSISITQPTTVTTTEATYSIKINHGYAGEKVYRLNAPAANGLPALLSSQQKVIISVPAKKTSFSSVTPFAQTKTVYTDTAPGFMHMVNWYGNRPIYLQKYTGGKWVNVSTINGTPYKTNNTIGQYKVTIPKGTAGTSVTYRLAIIGNNGYTAANTSSQIVKYLKPLNVPTYLSRTPFAYNAAYVPSYSQSTDAITVTNGAGRVLYLQKISGKTWVNVANYRLNSNKTQTVTVKTPVTTATTKITYRLVVPASGKYLQVISGAKTLTHENPRHYTGYKKATYDSMKAYCPNTIVTLLPRGNNLAYWPENRVGIVSNYNSATLKYVATHECAHTLQFKAFKGDVTALQARANRIYGGSGYQGLERQADCMSQLMGGNIRVYAPYTKSCSAAQVTAARTVLQGKRM